MAHAPRAKCLRILGDARSAGRAQDADIHDRCPYRYLRVWFGLATGLFN